MGEIIISLITIILRSMRSIIVTWYRARTSGTSTRRIQRIWWHKKVGHRCRWAWTAHRKSRRWIPSTSGPASARWPSKFFKTAILDPVWKICRIGRMPIIMSWVWTDWTKTCMPPHWSATQLWKDVRSKIKLRIMTSIGIITFTQKTILSPIKIDKSQMHRNTAEKCLWTSKRAEGRLLIGIVWASIRMFSCRRRIRRRLMLLIIHAACQAAKRKKIQ